MLCNVEWHPCMACSNEDWNNELMLTNQPSELPMYTTRQEPACRSKRAISCVHGRYMRLINGSAAAMASVVLMAKLHQQDPKSWPRALAPLVLCRDAQIQAQLTRSSVTYCYWFHRLFRHNMTAAWTKRPKTLLFAKRDCRTPFGALASMSFLKMSHLHALCLRPRRTLMCLDSYLDYAGSHSRLLPQGGLYARAHVTTMRRQGAGIVPPTYAILQLCSLCPLGWWPTLTFSACMCAYALAIPPGFHPYAFVCTNAGNAQIPALLAA